MGSGGLRGLQIPRSGVQSVRGGFDSHTFPPILWTVTVVALAFGAVTARADCGASFEAREIAATEDTSAMSRRAAEVADSSSIIVVSPEADSLAALPRVDRRARAAYQDSVRAAKAAQPQHWSDQPRWVMMRSLIIPGWGQAHNGAWIKAVAVAGAETWLIVGAISDRDDLDRLQGEINDAAAAGDASRHDVLVNEYNDLLNKFVGKQWLLAGVVAYSLLDAYVDAHFKNFDIEFRNDPALQGGPSSATQRLELRWHF
jgi:Family of unknown function (DUF5683)